MSYSHDISKYEPGRYFHFLVRARDSEGAVSGYVGPQNGFRKNQLPPAASIVFPPNNAITYRKNPRFAVKYGTEPEGDPQITQITINGVSSYQAASPNPGWWDIQGSSGTGYLPPGPGKTSMCTWGVALGYGTYEATIQNSDRSDWASTQQIRKITILEPVWTPATQGSILQADHILELRNALDNIFTYYGASPITWAHPSNVYSGITLAPSEAIAAIQELRDAIHTLAVYLNITTESSPMTVPTWTDSSITTLKAIHITEMQQMIPQL